jgi:hypothetical protein
VFFQWPETLSHSGSTRNSQIHSART